MANPTGSPIEKMIADLQPLDATEALNRVRGLVQTEPDYRIIGNDEQILPETLKWIGQLGALVDAMKLNRERLNLSIAERTLLQSQGSRGGVAIRSVLYNVLAHAELKAPAAAQGAFVAAGEQVDAYGAIAKILESANGQLLIVDPYMDATLVTDFLAATPQGVRMRLLADEASVKDTLVPVAKRWIEQHEQSRPLEVRFTSERRLHDRLIVIDNAQVWSLTQSVKDFAKRSHAAALKVDEETAALKIAAYADEWDAAYVVVQSC